MKEPIKLNRDQVRQLAISLVMWLERRYKFARFIRLTNDSVELDTSDSIKEDDRLVLELVDKESR